MCNTEAERKQESASHCQQGCHRECAARPRLCDEAKIHSKDQSPARIYTNNLPFCP